MRVFSKQRRFYLLKKKLSTYLVYALGEIVLIVFGILFALQIANWNQDKNDQQKVQAWRIKLTAEFEQNQLAVEQAIKDLTTVTGELSAFLSLMGPEPEIAEDNKIYNYIAVYFWNPSYTPRTIVFDQFVDSGDIDLLNDLVLKDALLEWKTAIRNNQMLVESISSHQDTMAEGWQDLYRWKSSIAMTGWIKHMPESQFPFDQNALLSSLH